MARRRTLIRTVLALALALGAVALGALVVAVVPAARQAFLEFPPVIAAVEWYERYRARVEAEEYAACLVRLDAYAVAYSEVAGQPANGNGCEIAYAVRVDRVGAARLSRPATMTCDLASRLGEWMAEVVQPAAGDLLGSRVARIDHVGTYACRNVAGRSFLSQHAYANAIDIGGMRLADGTRLTVEGDWRDDGARGAFMQRVGRSACSVFRMTLTPDYNASHSDHFHLDAGPYHMCGL